MTNILEELGFLDEENYIYLDKDGVAQKMIELTVHWNPVPKQVILVTVNRKYSLISDSLSYLSFRIGEAMEKYSTFSGLTNLRAINLMKSQVALPNIGIIGEYVKTGDHLTCDIASHDIWIDVEIECSHIQLVITFEIKVSQSIIIETLQYSLAEIVNKVLSTKNLPAQYEESDIHLKKIILDKSTETGGDYKKSIIDTHEKPHRILDLDSSQHIGQVLDYLNRYVMCVLSKRKKSEIEVVPSNTSHSYTINDTFNELACNFPIRFLKVEPKISINNNEVRSNKQILNENMSKQKMCNCSIF